MIESLFDGGRVNGNAKKAAVALLSIAPGIVIEYLFPSSSMGHRSTKQEPEFCHRTMLDVDLHSIYNVGYLPFVAPHVFH